MHRCGVKILWLVFLLALIAIIGSVLISGNILLYISPRMVPMAWFGLAVLAALFIYQTYTILECFHGHQESGKFKPGIILFMVPVLLMLTVAPDTGTPGSLPNQNVRMINVPGEGSTSAEETDGIADTEETGGTEKPGDTTDYDACVLEKGHIFFDSSADLFSDYLHETVETLVGKTITVYGFVYVDDTFPEDTVLISRLLLTCCAADASIVGFHVKVEPESGLQQNEWIRVTGTIRNTELLYYGSKYEFPIFTDGMIVRCDTPDVEDVYIYP